MGKRPILLFIFTDQQRADTLGCYGNRLVQTPNLDRLAADSAVFENAYVTQPVCTPSRSSIMTGLYPHTNGCTENNIPLRPETPTIAEMLTDSYDCAYYGKWHLGDEVVAQHGFTDWVSIEDLYRRYYTREEYHSLFSSYHHFLVENGFQPDVERVGALVFHRDTAARLAEPFTKARFVAREAVRFLHQHRQRPFVLYVNFLEPHPPYYSPFDDLYPPDRLTPGPTFRTHPPENAARINRILADFFMGGATLAGENVGSEAGSRKTWAKYLGLVTLVDRAVGDILQALAETGLADDTIVVYTSDHGDMMGDHGIFAKCCLYEEAVRVPLLVRVPWLTTMGRRIAGRISQIDLVPTLLDLLGQPIPTGLHGTSRSAVLRGVATLPSQGQGDAFIEWVGPHGKATRRFEAETREASDLLYAPWRTVVSAEGWKLNLSPVDRCELYDLNTDPHEQENLFDDPHERARRRDLADRIRHWQERTGDPVTLPTV